MSNHRKLFVSGTMLFALAGIVTSVTTAVTARAHHRGFPTSAVGREVQRSRPAAFHNEANRAHS